MTHEPDDKSRATVETMAGFGVPEVDIARVIDIDPKTLRKHYREQLDTAFIKANARVAQSLFRMATEGNNVAAAIFWLKARANWTERLVIDNRASHERPISEYTAAELGAEIARLKAALGTRGGEETANGSGKPDSVH